MIIKPSKERALPRIQYTSMTVKMPEKPQPAFVSLTRDDRDYYAMRQIKQVPTSSKYRPNYLTIMQTPSPQKMSIVAKPTNFKPQISNYKADLKPNFIKEKEVPSDYGKLLDLIDN